MAFVFCTPKKRGEEYDKGGKGSEKESTSASRRRTSCTNVGMGKNKCEHGRERRYCKDCGGSGICEHGRRRSVCKDCGGGSICEHGRRRSTCKDCGSGSDHVIVLEATEVEVVFDDDEEEPGEGLATVQAHVVAGPRGGKRKR